MLVGLSVCCIDGEPPFLCGFGWLSAASVCDCLRRRVRMQSKAARAAKMAAATTEPITIPAIAPPDKPLFEVSASAAAEVVTIGWRVTVAAGIETPSQREVALALTQHVSVELGELEAQYVQRPIVLDEKPQFFDSLSDPLTQLPLRELDGDEQTVKSARICFI